MSKSLKKLVEESREKNQPEVDMSDRGISNMLDVSGLSVPPNIAELKNLEVLNFFNNQIEELPTQISSLQKLKHLNLGMNRLNTLPRGFGSLPALEVLDLTYNNLNENSLPGNFFYLTTLRALYLSDNDFEILPPDIGKLTKLQILSLRDNDLISLPKEIGELTQLKELHIQGNRLTVLPPELASTADTCRQTQSPRRRIMTNRKRSAGSLLQPRTNEGPARTGFLDSSRTHSTNLSRSFSRINTVVLYGFLKKHFFSLPLSSSYCFTFEVLLVGGRFLYGVKTISICFPKIAKGRKQF
ncbi:ras suppressor protein 1 isoform X3 [Fukomys damarensis]|uniref:ras suppressor protein 1 isoform X3 n=1 Tax=Fukomys damarensis TaxID=885580 RepID=UPI00053F6B67|nr:ras suppressor protein 1 isoform X3 [Fukomys damarensis]